MTIQSKQDSCVWFTLIILPNSWWQLTQFYVNSWCILVPSTFGRARDTIWPCSMEAGCLQANSINDKRGGKKTSLTSSDLMPLKRAIFAAICHFVALCAGDRLAALWSSCTGWCLCNLWLRILSTITEETCTNQGDYSRSIPIGPYFMDSTAACNCHMGKSRNSHMYAWRVSYLCFRFPSINIFFPRATI